MSWLRPATTATAWHTLSKGSVVKTLSNVLDVTNTHHPGGSTKSMRRGGLSTAKRVGICKSLWMTQSGHQSKPHTIYESDSSSGEDDPGVPRAMPRGGWRVEDLYSFSRQFGL